MSSQPSASRSELLRQIEQAVRKVGAQSVLISDLVATRVGLNSTDLECLDLLYLAGATTAGALARHTGLTSGATTAVIDRLERAGFVRRRRDGTDRRRVLVEVVPSSAERILPLYAPLAARLTGLNERFGERQLSIVVAYLSRALEAGAEHVAWLQTQPVRPRRVHGTRRRAGREGGRAPRASRPGPRGDTAEQG
jgi:DNA-binding MarR family transcriptional regulator